MKKSKKNRWKVMILLTGIFAVMTIGITWAVGTKSISEYFFESKDSNEDGKEKNIELLESMIQTPEQTIQIDEYTFVLNEYLLEEKTGQFIAKLEVSKDGEKMELSSYNEGDILRSIDDRFYVRWAGGELEECRAEMDGDRVYIYVRDTISFEYDPDRSFGIMDIEKEDLTDHFGKKCYYFELDEIEKNVKIQTDQYCVYISPVGMKIYANHLPEDYFEDIAVEDAKGTKTVLVENNENKAAIQKGRAYNSEWTEYKQAYKYKFKNIIDYTKITKILINGEEYEVQ